MKTSKPFSTISYNSKEFLISELDKLVARRAISFYTFVYHYREEDERKDHIHLLIEPNGQINTDALSDILVEFDPSHPLDPLSVMPWRSSKFGDWYLYTSHDAAYLASKGQNRTHHYPESYFISSNSDYLHELITTIDRTKYAKTQEFVKKVQSGVTLLEMVSNGEIPAPQFNQWKQMYELVTNTVPERADRATHTPLDIDTSSGEVFE